MRAEDVILDASAASGGPALPPDHRNDTNDLNANVAN